MQQPHSICHAHTGSSAAAVVRHGFISCHNYCHACANTDAAQRRRCAVLITDPEGLEGWRPEDFQRPRPGGGRGMPDIDPDIGLPGPGRGTDWDSMYG
jgi:hypothetical protein